MSHPRGGTGTQTPQKHESLIDSMVFLLAANVLQRLVGFSRNVLFCRWLSAEELGKWSMTFDFLLLAAPLIVLGIPGSFARYVGYYRQHGLTRRFWLWSAGTCGLMAILASVTIMCFSDEFSSLILGNPRETPLIAIAAVTLVSVVAFNFITEWFGGLRQFRTVARMYFLNSVLFAVFSLGLLYFWESTAIWALGGYAACCMVCCIVAIPLLRDSHSIGARTNVLEGASREPIWSKVLPFAAGLWVTNLFANLLDLVDRYMLVHWSGLDAHAALTVVGHYHSSRIVPLLLVTMAGMVERVSIPHLSYDWEKKLRNRISTKLNLIVKVAGVGLWSAGVGVMIISPFLFGVAFQGKFADGHQVLPWTLLYCLWGAMTLMALTYLWCAERSRLGAIAFFGGLSVNVALNSLLIPQFGLNGAVLGTCAANLTTLGLTLVFGRRLGWKISPSVGLVILLPLVYPLGIVVSSVSLVGVIIAAVKTNWLFSPAEKKRILGWMNTYTGRFQYMRHRCQAAGI